MGSEFGHTFVVLPKPCRVLSRELLYTALTRPARSCVTVLMQGDLTDLKAYSSVTCSETAARLTNLVNVSSPVEVDGRFLEAGLIHKTRKGITVRSKSEVITTDLLHSKQIDFQYERPLIAADGSWRSPDFMIDDDTPGRIIYWEHLGILQHPSYRAEMGDEACLVQEPWRAAAQRGGGPEDMLVTTEDGDDGSISSADNEVLVDTLLG